ncbi:hypothetical protein EJ06DRAFT_270055 [Trichodelitschia bisporula]|uniref:Uncharacterized protein n=1 Tax=Trichodelitschia bisporula TaxID=703511 RepID=A0A6G1HI23_9PEZI|nr:hypothetical protein EJ06DRAFT_270055 [Trichodelitschia bisporula]
MAPKGMQCICHPRSPPNLDCVYTTAAMAETDGEQLRVTYSANTAPPRPVGRCGHPPPTPPTRYVPRAVPTCVLAWPHFHLGMRRTARSLRGRGLRGSAVRPTLAHQQYTLLSSFQFPETSHTITLPVLPGTCTGHDKGRARRQQQAVGSDLKNPQAVRHRPHVETPPRHGPPPRSSHACGRGVHGRARIASDHHLTMPPGRPRTRTLLRHSRLQYARQRPLQSGVATNHYETCSIYLNTLLIPLEAGQRLSPNLVPVTTGRNTHF